jgi:hypothetical protein
MRNINEECVVYKINIILYNIYYTLLIGLVFSMTILFICYLLIAYYKL